ncbi:MAG: hypothetical protein M0R06_02610 [Sphaerochaeta sp.]|jgi:hypothetical protein|nr:hypothetical protein [Sphaerochaeta sp.]
MALDTPTGFTAVANGENNLLTWDHYAGTPGTVLEVEGYNSVVGWTWLADVDDAYDSYEHTTDGFDIFDSSYWGLQTLYRIRARDALMPTPNYSEYTHSADAGERYGAAPTETVVASDSTTGYQGWATTATETVVMADAESDVSGYGHVATETISISETVTGYGNYVSSPTETVTLSEDVDSTVTWVVVATETVTGSDHVDYVLSVSSNFRYYWGSDEGVVYLYDPAYEGDGSDTITAKWETPETDLGLPDQFKTVYRASLKYVDKASSTPISVSISTNGGATWTGLSKEIGTGDGKTHTKDYHFVTSGEYFKFKVEYASATKKFQIIGLDVDFEPCGPAMETA